MRKLVLGIPAQASGKNLTRPLMPSAPQTSCVRATSPHLRKLGAGYVALPQMTGRRFGKPFILSPPTLALRFRQNNGRLRLLGTTSPRVRSPWLAALVEKVVFSLFKLIFSTRKILVQDRLWSSCY